MNHSAMCATTVIISASVPFEDCNDNHDEDFALVYLPLLAPGFAMPLLLAALFFCAIWVW
jgi:hypothetical protein